MTQGERVLEIRKALGLTMDKFGEKLGVQKSAISKIEKDKVNLSDQMVKLICREYNVNYDWLMDGEGEMFSDLPQTVLDELCSQYELDDLDRFNRRVICRTSNDVRDGIKGEGEGPYSEKRGFRGR